MIPGVIAAIIPIACTEFFPSKVSGLSSALSAKNWQKEVPALIIALDCRRMLTNHSNILTGSDGALLWPAQVVLITIMFLV